VGMKPQVSCSDWLLLRHASRMLMGRCALLDICSYLDVTEIGQRLQLLLSPAAVSV
jgi:hypothetical protein